MSVCVPSRDLTASSRTNKQRMRFNFSFFVLVALSASVCHTPTSVHRESHGATAAVVQGIPFVAATSDVSVRVNVCACLGATLNTIWTIATHTSSDF